MRIEIWSDVVCPWCYIGKRRLETALAGFEHRDDVEVVYRSFELDPSAPEVGHESVVEALGRKYGGGEANGTRLMARVGEVASEEGLAFDYAHATHTRTVDAHRLLHLALDEHGPAVQRELKELLLAAYFTRGESMGDQDVLRKAAVGAGLDPGRVDDVLASSAYADAVVADIDRARSYGVTGVPFFVVDGRYGVPGAQPVEVFSQLLDQAWAESHPGLTMVTADGAPGAAGAAGAAGDACGPDGCAV